MIVFSQVVGAFSLYPSETRKSIKNLNELILAGWCWVCSFRPIDQDLSLGVKMQYCADGGMRRKFTLGSFLFLPL